MKLNEFRGYDSWMDKNITVEHLFVKHYDAMVLPIYICWDETGANIIRASTSMQEVISALKGYAESL